MIVGLSRILGSDNAELGTETGHARRGLGFGFVLDIGDGDAFQPVHVPKGLVRSTCNDGGAVSSTPYQPMNSKIERGHEPLSGTRRRGRLAPARGFSRDSGPYLELNNPPGGMDDDVTSA